MKRQYVTIENVELRNIQIVQKNIHVTVKWIEAKMVVQIEFLFEGDKFRTFFIRIKFFYMKFWDFSKTD